MGIWNNIKDKLSGGSYVIVYDSRAHETIAVKCRVDFESKLVRSDAGQSWSLPEFDPTVFGKERVYLALGEKIVPWPTRERPAYDVMDDGTKIEVTPEHIDQIAEHAHQLGRMTGAAGITLTDRLIHLAAGAAIGMVLTFFLLKFINFSTAHTTGTTVTITNTTSNATTLANAIMPIAFRLRQKWGDA